MPTCFYWVLHSTVLNLPPAILILNLCTVIQGNLDHLKLTKPQCLKLIFTGYYEKRKGFKGTEYELRIQKYIQIFIWPKMIFFFRIGKGTTMNVSAENSHISIFRFLRGPHTVYDFQN